MKHRLTVLCFVCVLLHACSSLVLACSLICTDTNWSELNQTPMERFAEFVANERLHEEEMEKDHEEATDEDCIPLTYAGEFELTAYCSCASCCGVETGIMASGNEVYSGAIGSNFFELGTKLYIEGYGCFVVEDTGNMESVVLDIWMPSHEEALEFGRQYADVYVMEE